MPSVLLVEDHPIFRRGLKQILSDHPEYGPIGEAADAQEALEQLRRQRWDAIILDLNLTGKSGLELLIELKREYPTIPKLVLSVYPEDQYALRTLRAGACGYLNKTRAPEELLIALEKILRGQKSVSDSFNEKLLSDIDKREKPLQEKLSKREFEILRMIVAGNPPRVIAKELCLSPRTVNTYRSRILEKLNVKSNADLIQYVLQQKLD